MCWQFYSTCVLYVHGVSGMEGGQSSESSVPHRDVVSELDDRPRFKTLHKQSSTVLLYIHSIRTFSFILPPPLSRQLALTQSIVYSSTVVTPGIQIPRHDAAWLSLSHLTMSWHLQKTCSRRDHDGIAAPEEVGKDWDEEILPCTRCLYTSPRLTSS